MGHQPLAVVAERDDRQFEIDPTRILRHELVDLRHVHEPDREELNALVGVLQEVFHPLHRLGMEEEIGPFHVLVSAQTPELLRVGRLPADVVEDIFPILVGRLGRIRITSYNVCYTKLLRFFKDRLACQMNSRSYH